MIDLSMTIDGVIQTDLCLRENHLDVDDIFLNAFIVGSGKISQSEWNDMKVMIKLNRIINGR